jgi:uncharacterized protein DUF4389
MADGTYPARLGIDAPLEVQNWRPLVHWLLAIPQLLVANALRGVRQVLESYPPFSFTMTPQDDGIDPAWLSVDYPRELNRWAPLYKWLLAIPHYIVLILLWIGASAVIIISFFAVLFTGKWPEGLRRYVVGVARWGLRVSAYVAFLRDEYPPFSLENGTPDGTPAVATGGPVLLGTAGQPPTEPPTVPPPPPGG